MRRWIVFAVLFGAACGWETPDTTTMPAGPPHARPRLTTSQPAIASPPHTANKSTPRKCAGDGSYEQALECFRITTGFSFVITEARGVERDLHGVRIRAQGEMTRSTPGMERVRCTTTDGAVWTAEAKKTGVVWSRNGKHEQSPPDFMNRVWQRTTMVLDPQKREGAPQLVGTERIAGEPCNHDRFTNANNGEANDVWVSALDGRIMKWTAGASTLELPSCKVCEGMIR